MIRGTKIQVKDAGGGAIPKCWVQAFGDGDLIASATLQPGLDRFETSFGCWVYRRVAGIDVTLGGPLCAPHDRPRMLERFLARSPRPLLTYLRAPMLEVVQTQTRLHCAGIGIDRHVDLQALLRDPKKPVRGALRRARRVGLRLRELPDSARLDPVARAQVTAITARYLAHAAVKVEMSFLNWPMAHDASGLRRVFMLEKFDAEHRGPFGYAVLNPIFRGGRRSGYLLDILRFDPTRLWGVWLSCVHALAQRLAEEGEELSLGYCPLHAVQAPSRGGSRILQAQIDWMARNLSTTRYLERLRTLKGLIPGPSEQRYIASFTRAAPVSIYAFVEAMGVPLLSLVGRPLLEVLREGRLAQRTPNGAPVTPSSSPGGAA